MFREEFVDSIKKSIVIFLLVVGLGIFSFLTTRYILGVEVRFSDIMGAISWISLIPISLYLGSTLFSRERANNTFEYFYSLPISREKILVYKVFPRLFSLFLFFIIYIFLDAILFIGTLIFQLNQATFLIFLLGVFFFSASKSLMYKKDSTIFIAGIFGILVFFVLVWVITGVIYLKEEKIIFDYFTVGLIILGLALFIGFFFRFMRFDIDNMYRLSRKNVFQVLLPVAVFLFLFIGINQFDTRKPENLYTSDDLVPASFEKSNGFYKLWTLPEPRDVDVNSTSIINKYRKLFDPQFENEKYLRQFDFRSYRSESKRILENININFEYMGAITPSMWDYLVSNEKELEKMKQDYSFLIERYQRLVNSPKVIDFSSPKHWNQPTFDIRFWIKVSKLYIAVNALDAIKGNWEHGVSNIIANIEMTEKVSQGSRLLITNLIAKSIATTSLQVLVELMNRDECPPEVYKQIFDGLPLLRSGEFGSKNSLIFEAVTFTNLLKKNKEKEYWEDSDIFNGIRNSLFMQKNRTMGYMQDYTQEIIQIEDTPPYQWETGLSPLVPLNKGAFWWFFNPEGKTLFSYYSINFQALIFKTYRVRTIYEMTRISAQLHLNDEPGCPVQEVLNGLDIYNTDIDPCSGKPYRWNARKKVLYSIGTDRKDNNGEYDITTFKTDFAIPIRLKNRN